MIASSLASSSSALVLNPFRPTSSAIPLLSCLPLPQPLVTVALRVAASAMTFLMSAPLRTGAPPNFWPDPAVRVRLCSAEARARRRASSIGIRRPPSFFPSERKPSPVYPFLVSCSCSSRNWFHRAWNCASCGPCTICASSCSIVSTTSSIGKNCLSS